MEGRLRHVEPVDGLCYKRRSGLEYRVDEEMPLMGHLKFLEHFRNLFLKEKASLRPKLGKSYRASPTRGGARAQSGNIFAAKREDHHL